ncbi:hypothetical protein IIO_02436 [Bacillus cereus VD115]|nr:hypothetical protein IIO_02436 [Bacillus cereus VD115]
MNKKQKFYILIAYPCFLVYLLLFLGSAIYIKNWLNALQFFFVLCGIAGLAAIDTGKGKKKWVLTLYVFCIVGNLVKITVDFWFHNYKD